MADFDASRQKNRSDDGAGPDIVREALIRYSRWYLREQKNVAAAYEDLRFCWADEQWPDYILQERTTEERPILTVNRLPQFVHQVTGDMRQLRPAIKPVPVDSVGDPQTAETIGGMLRYIENRSDADSIYYQGADSQVSCGIGAWRVVTEYADATTFNQEIRISTIDDAVGIAWDTDSKLPTREDAKWCIVPYDISRESFEERYPDFQASDFDNLQSPSGANLYQGWYDKDSVRIAEYWKVVPMKRRLALMPQGGIIDLTGKSDAEISLLNVQRIETRDSHKIVRYMVSAAHVLETAQDYPGLYIPIIPVLGEEVRIGRDVIRRGLIRSAKDPQRMFNYFCSAQAEVIALQPKAPWLVTKKNVEQDEEMWSTANRKAHPYLVWTPDERNGGSAPSRVQPPVSSQGISEGIALSAENMKAVIGIYDANLGAKSNETSGVAIRARQREGDTGSYVYIDNWTRAIRRTGVIILDLLPHVYDTERVVRILGEDGQMDIAQINKTVGVNVQDPRTGLITQQSKVLNDLTVGAYDIVLETGPSYSTKREEAKDAMTDFVRNAPEVAPAVLDLIAKAQDWPLAQDFAERLEAIAPPPVQKLIAQKRQEQGNAQPAPPPTPEEQQAQQLQQRAVVAEVAEKEGNAKKALLEAAQLEQELQGGGGDPVAAAKAQGQLLQNERDTAQGAIDLEVADINRQIALVNLEKAKLELAKMASDCKIETTGAVLDLSEKRNDMDRADEMHQSKMAMANEPAPAR